MQGGKLRPMANSLARGQGVRRGPALNQLLESSDHGFGKSLSEHVAGWADQRQMAIDAIQLQSPAVLSRVLGRDGSLGEPSSRRQIPDKDTLKQLTSRKTEPGEFSPMTLLGLHALQGYDMSRSR